MDPISVADHAADSKHFFKSLPKETPVPRIVKIRTQIETTESVLSMDNPSNPKNPKILLRNTKSFFLRGVSGNLIYLSNLGEFDFRQMFGIPLSISEISRVFPLLLVTTS